MRERMQSLKNLRTWRVFPDRDTTIARQVGAAVREASGKNKHSGAAVAAWEAAAPAGLRSQCEARVANGVLTIKAGSAGARYQVDRWLRGGGTAALRSGGVSRVKVI